MTIVISFAFVTLTTLAEVTQQSIAGVTYMDNFDFEERYRNPNECNPLHWHPLHLPSKCAKIYEKLIRSRLSSYSPYLMTDEADPYNLNDDDDRDSDDDDNSDDTDDSNGDMISYQPNIYTYKRERAPFDIMLDALRQDVLNDPSVPKIQNMPNLGVAAVYHQPISRKTEDIIKQVALQYGKAGAEAYVQAGLFSKAITTTENSVLSITGVYKDGVENGPSRTHYKFQYYPRLKNDDTQEHSGPKVKTYKKNKRYQKKKIVDGDTVYYIIEKNMG